MSSTPTQDAIRTAVREQYGAIAESDTPGCCAPSCCAPESAPVGSEALGYSPEDLASLPPGTDLGLGCGNPHAIANLRVGETVLDLGSGPGMDCLLAAKQVGPTGRVIGVDMTPAMITKARENVRTAGADHVDIRLGEIEALPVANDSVDVILSNCVINLSPDQPRVFREAFRVLKPGGRLAIRDIVLTGELSPELAASMEALVGCVSNAAQASALEVLLRETGFTEVEVRLDEASRAVIDAWMPGTGAGSVAVSAEIMARKPEVV